MKHKLEKISRKFIESITKSSQLGPEDIIYTLSLLFIFLFTGCADQEQTRDERISLLELQTLPEVSFPIDNPPSEAKEELGRLLFWDPILSGERDVACATCHIPSLGYGDGIELSIGPGGTGIGVNRIAGVGRPIFNRNSTSLINVAYVGLRDANQQFDVLTSPLNWHINRRALEAQAFGPLSSAPLMRGKGAYDAASTPDTLVNRLKKIAEYVTLFNNAFDGTGVTRANLGKAVSAFERSLISNNSPYDQYAKGQLDALTEQQKAGLLLFFGKANCSTCHSGPMFSDYSLYNIGIKYHPLVNPPTFYPKDKGANNKNLFRTPSLRNTALTAPYMHNGTVATLRDVLELYNKGVSENDSIDQSQLTIRFKPLNLTEDELDKLHSFLEALTDESYDKVIPSAVPSGLKVGGN